MNSSTHVFHGDNAHAATNRHPDSPQNPEPYVPTPDLVRAVNLALFLRRPLLLEGEAGCGKSRLAYAVAYELGWPLYFWPIRSTSKAQDGFYSYDAIRRLYDVQVNQLGQGANTESPTESQELESSQLRRRDPRRAQDYREFGPLGKAFSEKQCTSVVLIDEIDKADIDFPNDLLTVLDEPWAFPIPETGEWVAAASEHRPLVIITSNKEKGNLPAPFLRRCLYYYMDFPDKERMGQIVDTHYQTENKKPPEQNLATGAIDRFQQVRQDANLFRKPGTSEFLDWLEALHSFDDKEASPQLVAQDPIPYPELLFKLRTDWQKYNKPSAT
ncbi:hypothetical protein IAD21_04521 [Abditibacteriota bacterium]|nr:hypothetical protein IAD21_04521 [Abditibacteriota bacterium]